ncbi:MAG: glycosyltransferase [Chloroflexi bacterium]|nr:glycosyltransferase [Chloroflexota bacterium]
MVYPGIDPDLAPVKDEEKDNGRSHHLRHHPTPTSSTWEPCNHVKTWYRLVQASVQSSVPHQLVLAGKPGWLSRPILDEVAQVKDNHQRQNHLVGYVAEADKAALLSGATALLFPSLYEGFGFPALEAQACGAPVLTATTRFPARSWEILLC